MVARTRARGAQNGDEMADDKQGTRDFCDVLTDIDDGVFHADLGRAFRALVKGVQDTNKAGALTISIGMKTESGRVVVLTPKVTTKVPQRASNPTRFYVDESGNATRNDPKQVTMTIVSPTPIRPSGKAGA